MRQRALKVVLVLFGLLFCAAVYPLILMLRQEPALSMLMSIYATLGIFLLLASRNPSTNRSLIAFTAYSSLFHAAVMAVQVSQKMIERRELAGVAMFGVVGIVLIALAPAKSERTSAAALAHS